ncbi:unnamed protein product [Rotaria sp. Silwood1]|nr:unnamed protein product [Rotaria sp. Silwood1]
MQHFPYKINDSSSLSLKPIADNKLHQFGVHHEINHADKSSLLDLLRQHVVIFSVDLCFGAVGFPSTSSAGFIWSLSLCSVGLHSSLLSKINSLSSGIINSTRLSNNLPLNSCSSFQISSCSGCLFITGPVSWLR